MLSLERAAVPPFFKSRSTLVLLILLLLGLGMFRFNTIPVALYPRASQPLVVLGVSYDNVTPKDFLETHANDISERLEVLEGVSSTEVRVSDGWAQFRTTFDWGSQPDEVKKQVEDLRDSLKGDWPRSWGDWVYFDESSGASAYAALQSETIPRAQLSEFLRQSLQNKLESQEGVASVFLRRFDHTYVRVLLHPEKLHSLKLSAHSVKQILGKHLRDRSVGKMERSGQNSQSVVVSLKSDTVQSLRSLPLLTAAGRTITLDAVATVSQEPVSSRRAYLANGLDAAVIGVEMKPDANIKQVADNFFSAVEDSIADQPEMTLVPLINPSEFIEEAVASVLWAVLGGMLVSGVVVFLFLGALRGTLLISLAMPLSLAGGFVFMDLLGIEINLISMGAMALSVGMVVDGAVVVIENIDRMARQMASPIQSLAQALELSWKSTKEVALPVIASIGTTVVVFAPLSFTSPIASAVLGDLAVVMVCVLLVSLAVCLVLIPALVAWLGLLTRPERSGGIYGLSRGFNIAFGFIRRIYLSILSSLLSRPAVSGLSIAAIASLTLGSLWFAHRELPREIIGKAASRTVGLNFRFKEPVDDPQQRLGIFREVGTALRQELGDRLSHTFTNSGNDWGVVLIFLRDKEETKAVRERLEELFPETTSHTTRTFDWTPSSLTIEEPDLLEVHVHGESDETLRQVLEDTSGLLRQDFPKAQIFTTPWSSKSDQLTLQPDWEKIGHLQNEGLLPGGVDSVIQSLDLLFGPAELTEWQQAGDKVEVKLELPEKLINSRQRLENWLIDTGAGPLPLRAFFRFEETQRWSNYVMEEGKPVYSLTVAADPERKTDVSAVKARLDALLASAQASGLEFTFDYKETDAEVKKTIWSLAQALAISFLLILLIVTFQFGSLRKSAIVLSAIPLGVLGSALALVTFDSVLSMNSMLGLILLCGTAVNNSILFVDFYQRSLREEPHMDVSKAIVQAASLRFRPIAMTTLTTIFGMLPIALGWGSGGEVLKPLGVAISGGLGVSALLTLFVVPLLLAAVFQRRSAAPQHVAASEKKIDRSAATPSPGGSLPEGATAWLVGFLVLPLLVWSASGQTAWAQATSQFNLKTFEQAVTDPSSNPSLRASEARLSAGEEERSALWAELLPQLETGATHCFYGDGPTAPSLQACSAGDTTYGATLRESIRSPWKLHKKLQINEAKRERQQELQKRDLRNQLSAVRAAYVDVFHLQESIQLNKSNLAVTQKNQADVEQRFKRGGASRQDLIQATLIAEELGHEAKALQARFRGAEKLLFLKAGLPKAGSSPGQNYAPPLAEQKDLRGLAEQALNQLGLGTKASSNETNSEAAPGSPTGPNMLPEHSDLAAEAQQLGILQAERNLELFNLAPDLALEARARWNEDSNSLGDASQEILLTATWTLRSSDYWSNNKRESDLAAALAEFEAKKISLQEAVQTGALSLQQSLTQLQRAKGSAALRRELLQLSAQQYERGQISAREYDDALRDEINASQQVLDAERNLLLRLYQLGAITPLEL